MTNYKISTDNKLIFIEMQGELSVREIIDFLTVISMDEIYNPSYNSIVDLQNYKSVPSAIEAREIIESAALIRSNTPAKSAIVTNGIFKKNLVDMASWLSKRKTLEVKGFTNILEACRWLQVDERKWFETNYHT